MVPGITIFLGYNGDGVTTAFEYPNYLFQFSDLIAWYTDPSGDTVQLLLNSDYNLTGIADDFGAYPGGVTLHTVGACSPLPAGGTLFITRATQRTQLFHPIDGDALPATFLEHAFDKLTLLAQEQTLFLGMATGPPLASGSFPGQWYQCANPSVTGYFGWVWNGTNWMPYGIISL